MSRVLLVGDKRDELFSENELQVPVRWKLSCGATAGATAQSSEWSTPFVLVCTLAHLVMSLAH